MFLQNSHDGNDGGEHEGPSFSLGLTQEEKLSNQNCSNGYLVDIRNTNFSNGTNNKEENEEEAEPELCRKSKRSRIAPPRIVADYHCGAYLHNRVDSRRSYMNLCECIYV